MDFELMLTANSRGLVQGEQALDSIAAKAERTQGRAGTAMAGLAKSTEAVGRQSIFASQQMRMQAMQLSQVAQQASATGNILQAVAIQLPDLALGFGPIGIAAGAAAGAILSYIASYEGADDANEILEQQVELIRQVADRWGEAAPALQAYVETLDRAKEAAEDVAAQEAFADEQFRAAREALPDLIVGFDDLTSKLRLAGEEQENIGQLERAFAALKEAVESNSDPAEELDALQKALAVTANSAGIPAIEAFTSTLYGFGNAALTAAGNVQTLVTQMSAAQTLSAIRGLNAPLAYENNSVPDPAIEIPTPDRRPLIELDGLPGEFGRGRGGRKGRKGGRGGKSQAELYDDLIKDAERRVASLTAEREAVGLSEQAAEKLRSETEMLNDAQQKGIKLTDDQKEKISGLADQMGTLEAETKAAQEQMDFFNDISDDLKDGILDAIVEGKNLDDVFQDLAKTIAKAALEAALFGSGPLSGGGSNGGGFGGVVGGLLGKLFSFEGGGSTGSGSRSGGLDGKGGYMALVHPNETVIDHTKSVANSNSPQKVDINVNVSGARGNREIQEMVAAGVQQGIGKYDSNFEGRLSQAMERSG